MSVLGGTDLEADDIEKSKLLGGDVEHTHLVKGLDFALMQRTREELEAKKKEQLYVESLSVPSVSHKDRTANKRRRVKRQLAPFLMPRSQPL